MIQTVSLNNGTKVLAKTYKDGTTASAVFVNFKQANKKVAELTAQGINCEIIGFGEPAKFIKITD